MPFLSQSRNPTFGDLGDVCFNFVCDVFLAIGTIETQAVFESTTSFAIRVKSGSRTLLFQSGALQLGKAPPAQAS